MRMVRDYCVQEGFNLIIQKNAGYRYTVRCAHPKCSWRLHAPKLPDGRTFQVETYRKKHVDYCPKLVNNPMANTTWVAHKLIDEFRVRGDMDAKDIVDAVMKNYSVELKKHVARRARRIMLFQIEERHDLSYLKLAHYIEMVKKPNPGSHAYIT